MSTHLTVQLKSHKKPSSARWLKRQLNDPYVEKAHSAGYRGRAAFKIIELDSQFHFFKKNAIVVDLGAAPGGWSQVAVQRVGSTEKAPSVFGLDLLTIQPLQGAQFLQMDFLDESAPQALCDLMKGKADVVMSDMAPNTTGQPQIDHLRIMALVEAAYDFAKRILKPNGCFIAKVFQGGTENKFLAEIKKDFALVKHAKPQASRKESKEFYIIAKGFIPPKDT